MEHVLFWVLVTALDTNDAFSISPIIFWQKLMSFRHLVYALSISTSLVVALPKVAAAAVAAVGNPPTSQPPALLTNTVAQSEIREVPGRNPEVPPPPPAPPSSGGTNSIPINRGTDVTGPNPTEIIDQTPTTSTPTIDRTAVERAIVGGDFSAAVGAIEEANTVDFQAGLGLSLYGSPPTIGEISSDISRICNQTGERAAVIYAVSLEKALQLMAILPNCTSKQSSLRPTWITAALDFPRFLFSQNPTLPAAPPTPIRKSVPEANRRALEATLKNFRRRISDPRERRNQNYLVSSQQLYQWLVQPLDAELKLNQIDTLVYSMGPELRSLPLAALNDGKQFLIEQYSVAQIPSFGMTDTRLSDIRKGKVLAMGASQFINLPALPGVPTELGTVVNSPNLTGQEFINQDFTLERFTELNRKERFAIVHLATHGEFRPGNLNRSFIQFWDQRLSIPQLQALAKSIGWRDPKSVPVDLLVLSACKTALGDDIAELGFAGLALSTGIKSTMASLWSVSDLGTLTLMTEFYQSLGMGLGKAQALRQAQLQLLRGNAKIEDGKIFTTSGNSIPLPKELAQETEFDLRHPYYWSAFTLFGNWH